MKIIARYRIATGWFFRLNDENGPTLTEAQANEIVRCVNAHDELIATVRELIDAYQMKEWTSVDVAIAHGRAALAKAGAA